jgi:methionyl-tRNA formyltransferase
VDRLVRLGGAWTTVRGTRLKVHAVELVDSAASGCTLRGDVVGGVRLRTVQPEGRAPMEFASFARGARLAADEQLGAD